MKREKIRLFARKDLGLDSIFQLIVEILKKLVDKDLLVDIKCDRIIRAFSRQILLL